ncbi:MAG TPA: gliding motility protein GldL [Saprospiraceae bacterium]|nr:gliding motility protein GldL [Saprospiraceae bacterium]
MAIYKQNWFKYAKNLVIGVGASVVMIGALFKILSLEGGDQMLTAGLVTEAFLFLLLGLIPPDKDYYWEKLYPGLEDYESRINPLTEGPQKGGARPINGDVVENQLSGMLGELQMMSKSLGSLKALQEVDFSKTGDQIKGMGNFYTRMNEAMAELGNSLEDTKNYKNQVAALNKNLTNLNSVYGNILGAYKTMGSSQS